MTGQQPPSLHIMTHDFYHFTLYPLSWLSNGRLLASRWGASRCQTVPTPPSRPLPLQSPLLPQSTFVGLSLCSRSSKINITILWSCPYQESVGSGLDKTLQRCRMPPSPASGSLIALSKWPSALDPSLSAFKTPY